jgi:hypothetical protein
MAASATIKGRVMAVAGIAIAAGAGALLARTDLLLSRGFGNALDASRPSLSFETVAAKDASPGITAGDEGYWLTRAEVESPTPFAKPLAIGDRITISSQGHDRQLEVVDLKAIGGNLVRTGQTANPHLLLVTCRVAGEAAGEASAPVRFIVEAQPTPAPAPAAAKAL